MGQQIVEIHNMGDALRNTGYKDISAAISEIVDNSIEAGAKDVFIIMKEDAIDHSRRTTKQVKEIVILDNGSGMNYAQLSSCLGIGVSSRRDRKGMGRFGVGLPQSSLYACPIVNVYSWQEGVSNAKCVELDIEKVKSKEQLEIEDPKTKSLPEEYIKFLSLRTENKNFDFKAHGTMVLWKDCDRVNPKTFSYLVRDLAKTLGQKYRYMLNAKTVEIHLINLDNLDSIANVSPNDPMFLMENNQFLGSIDSLGQNVIKGEPIFEIFGDGIKKLDVKYVDSQGAVRDGIVQLTFSKIKDSYYSNIAFPTDSVGNTPMGKHAKEVEGISVVRAGREIDFGKFDFYDNINEPTHRWWGCEISFNPELDEAFGVANNKQYVELKELKAEEYEEDEVKPMWLQLAPVVKQTIKAMFAANKETRKLSRAKNDITTPSEAIVNAVERNSEVQRKSDILREQAGIEQAENIAKEALIHQNIAEPSKDEIDEYIKNRVNVVYKNLMKGGPFFGYSNKAGVVELAINTSHIFYSTFSTAVETSSDTKIAFELFLMSFVDVANELSVDDDNDRLIDKQMTKWNDKLRTYIEKQHGKN